MHGVRRLLAIATVALPAAAAATPIGPVTVEGHVSETASRWTSDGSRIVTEATVRTASGEVRVSQLGGTADGLTMRVIPGPAPLVRGMRVAIAAHEDRDLAQRPHLVVDQVRVLALPPDYVRTGPTKAGNSLRWESGCIFVTADAAGTKHLPGELEFEVIEQAIATWNTAAATCSYLELVYQGPADQEVGRDQVNVIKFRDASWCRPATDDDPARCYAESAAGITTAVYIDDGSSDRDGAIVDADIEINGNNFAISHEGVTLGTAPCRAELANTLTHELGHLLGIEHPCRAAGDPERVDAEGQPVPSCSTVSDPAITESTMYNFQDCDETKKATLEADDLAAVCGIFPLAEDPGSCQPVTLDRPGCCSASERSLPPAPTLLLVGLTALVLRRRARR